MNRQAIPHIDTNIFLRFLVYDQTNPQLSQKAKTIVHQIKNGSISVQANICIINELIYVLEGYYDLRKSDVVEKILPLISLEHLHLSQKPLVIAALYTYQNLNVDFEDAYTYQLIKEAQETKVYTFDKKHFQRFSDIKILD